MRVVGLRLQPGQTVPQHRNAIPVALIGTGGRLQCDDGMQAGGDPELRADPCDCDGAEDVAVRERHEPRVRVPGHKLDELPRSFVDLLRRLAAGTAVLVDLPAGIRFVDLPGAQALIATVVDLLEQRRDARLVETGELGRTPGALHGTGVHGVELDAGEPAPKRSGFGFTSGGEWEIGGAGVLTRTTPIRFAVAGEVELERQAGLPIISGRPERSDRLALSMTAPARTRCPGRTQTRPTAAWAPWAWSASFTATRTRLAACAVPATSVSGRMAS